MYVIIVTVTFISNKANNKPADAHYMRLIGIPFGVYCYSGVKNENTTGKNNDCTV